MKASILDLRYRMKDVLKALERKEKVSILYHGKLKGVINAGAETICAKVTEHLFFNIRKSARLCIPVQSDPRFRSYPTPHFDLIRPTIPAASDPLAKA